MIIIIAIALPFTIFILWDLLTQGTHLDTGTWQGVQYIANHPDMWGEALTGIVLVALLIGLFWIVSLLILPFVGSGGMSKDERDDLNKTRKSTGKPLAK